MNSVKLILIAMEASMIIGFLMIIFFTNMSMLEFKLLASLMALNAIVFQKEQQSIKLDLGEKY